MSKIEILNELRRCVEPTQEGWDVWFHGAYLGTIVKVKAGFYQIIRTDSDCPFGERTNFMAAISSFIPQAVKVYQDDYREMQEAYPVIRSIGVSKAAQKTVWQKIKGWFK